ncbi:uncharacterized protein LOC131940458 [Physella acuta]|uniref:uncharacterized protein LOC131940458 n=1 Tax=Physella acuta TaxID=109671 RepID=UPI0027DB1558|nr:uncharacterized protein LOC131940458 [Physella acuta]
MMTSVLMTRYTSTAVMLLGLWTLPSSGEVSQNSSDGTCSAPTSQNGALALIPTFENDTLHLTDSELHDLIVKKLKYLNLAIDMMLWKIVILFLALGLLSLNLYKIVMELEICVTGSGQLSLGCSCVVVNAAEAAKINSISPDQSMPGTAEVPTNRSESADPAGLTIAVPDCVPVEVPVNVQVYEPVPASITDNTASLVTMRTKSHNCDDREDDETLVPLSL